MRMEVHEEHSLSLPNDLVMHSLVVNLIRYVLSFILLHLEFINARKQLLVVPLLFVVLFPRRHCSLQAFRHIQILNVINVSAARMGQWCFYH